MSAGTYTARLQRLIHASTHSTSNGDETPSYTPGAYLWCRFIDVSSAEQDAYSNEQSVVVATIGIRNFPTIKAKDRLQDADGGIYTVQSLYEGEEEWVCECSKWDAMEDA